MQKRKVHMEQHWDDCGADSSAVNLADECAPTWRDGFRSFWAGPDWDAAHVSYNFLGLAAWRVTKRLLHLRTTSTLTPT